jgi:two-component system, OmpR family, KDP operon response regulator KdpE
VAERVSGAHTHCVLLVEDEPAIRELLSTYLTDEGLIVRNAVDGVEGLRLLTQPGPPVCVILLDLALPDMSGLTVLDHLRQSGTEAAVVALSAHDEALAAALDAGAQLAVAKPFDLTDLLAVVTRHCPQAPG